MDQIVIFDTTLRDGEQSPGCSMNLKEKIEVARCLEKMKVDVIEAGFAISSPGDFESVKTIAGAVKDCTVASLARANILDIDTAWDAVKEAADPRIHLFIATSQLHMDYKLKMTPDQVLEAAYNMTAHAKKYCSNIEFSAEDATRSDWDFLVKVVDAAIRALKVIIRRQMTLKEFTIQAISKGSDDVGKVHMQVEYDGHLYYGFGANTDIVTASVEAYIDCINKFKK